MGAYEVTKTQINSKIKANGQNEITGPILNGVLQTLINELSTGMLFVGQATPFTDPVVNDVPKFYITSTPGSYTNFMHQPPVYTSGIAVIYDKTGTNTWEMEILLQTSNTQSFVIDARITNNTYSGDTIIYVDEVTNTTTPSFNIKKVTSSTIGSPTTLATITDTGKQSGFKTYNTVLDSDTQTSLDITVNWSAVDSGVTTHLGLTGQMPKSAYASLPVKETDLTNVWNRIRYAEYAIGYSNNGEAPNPEYDGAFIKKIDASFGTGVNIDPMAYSRYQNAFLPVGHHVAVRELSKNYSITIDTTNFPSTNPLFNFKITFMLFSSSSAESDIGVTFKTTSIAFFPITGATRVTVPAGGMKLVTLYGLSGPTTGGFKMYVFETA